MATFPEEFEAMLIYQAERNQNLDARTRALISEMAKEAASVEGLPPEQWPAMQFNWDLSPESAHFCLDGCSPDRFAELYPSGVRYGRCAMEDFERRLTAYSRRQGPGDVWGVGQADRLARVIARVSRGLPMTPPLVRPLPTWELAMVGGHHRYAAAKYSGESSLVIGTTSDDVSAVSQLLQVTWLG